MKLPHDSRQYARCTFSGLPDIDVGTPEIQVFGVWRPMEWDGPPGPSRKAKFLVYGPDAPAGSGLELPVGRTWVRKRVVDTPEVVVIPETDYIDVI